MQASSERGTDNVVRVQI